MSSIPFSNLAPCILFAAFSRQNGISVYLCRAIHIRHACGILCMFAMAFNFGSEYSGVSAVAVHMKYRLLGDSCRAL